MPDPTDLDRRLARVQLLLLDVDGVLTDGGVTIDNQGVESKTFHIRDGLALRAWQRAGLAAGIVTGRTSRVVELRAAELGIGIVRQGVDDKLAVADACDDLRRAADVVTGLPGGRGAVRELIERMLRARGGWDAVVSRYAASRT